MDNHDAHPEPGPAAEPAIPDPEAERALQEVERRIADAVLGRDLDAVDRIWDDDFIYTGVRGEVKGKADILAELRAGDLRFDVLRFDDLRVRVYGGAAMVTGRATTRGGSVQGEITGEFRYTRVYARRQGRWRLVAFQGTPIVRT